MIRSIENKARTKFSPNLCDLKFILLFLLPISSNLISENLVRNPSFESSSCTEYIGYFNTHASGWTAPTSGTTDLFNTCTNGDAGIPDNHVGHQDSKFGKVYAGCYLYSKNNKHTEKIELSNKGKYNASYYYIDMVKVEKSYNSFKKSENNIVVKNKGAKPVKNKVIQLNKSYVFENITFDFKSAGVSEKAKKEINYVFTFLEKNANTNISISGHTDNVGTDEYNIQLSKKRAKSVAEYLINLGINKKRITTIGYGASYPVESNTTEEGRKKNRRVAFIITKT